MYVYLILIHSSCVNSEDGNDVLLSQKLVQLVDGWIVLQRSKVTRRLTVSSNIIPNTASWIVRLSILHLHEVADPDWFHGCHGNGVAMEMGLPWKCYAHRS